MTEGGGLGLVLFPQAMMRSRELDRKPFFLTGIEREREWLKLPSV